MAITLPNVELLLDRELNKRKTAFKATIDEIKALEMELEEKKVYAGKLSFYVDKLSKVVSIIEMDKKSKKPFEEIHSDIPLEAFTKKSP